MEDTVEREVEDSETQAEPLSTIIESRELQDGLTTHVTDISVVPRIVSDSIEYGLDDENHFTVNRSNKLPNSNATLTQDDVLRTLNLTEEITEETSVIDETSLFQAVENGQKPVRPAVFTNFSEDGLPQRIAKARFRYDVVVTLEEGGLKRHKKLYSRHRTESSAEHALERLNLEEGDEVELKLDKLNNVVIEKTTRRSPLERAAELDGLHVMVGIFAVLIAAIMFALGNLVLGTANLATALMNIGLAAMDNDLSKTKNTEIDDLEQEPDGVSLLDVEENYGHFQPASDTVTVEMTETDDSITLSEVNGDRVWEAEKENGFLSEESVRFFEQTGFDEIDDTRMTLTARQATEEDTPYLTGKNTDYNLFPPDV